MSRSIHVAAVLLLMSSGWATALSAQARLTDLVFSGGLAVEQYRGGIPSVTLPVVDSVDEASAVSVEFGARAVLNTNPNGFDGLTLTVDGGVRQFDAYGFKLRDYAPRVSSGVLDAVFRRTTNHGVLQFSGRAGGREVVDRTPTPLFLEPGYANYEGSALFQTREIGGTYWDASIEGGRSDYNAQDIVPQLDLLDRNKIGFRLGASQGRMWNAARMTMRFYGSFTEFRYPKQGTSYPPDPFRRDRAYQLGALWQYDGLESSDGFESPGITAEVGIRGTINRSNASRTEYNAVSMDAEVSTPLPADMRLNVTAVLTAKDYLTETEFIRLIPGEEADNASRVFVGVSKYLTDAINALLQVGWTRAETEIGDAYFERYSGRFLVHYRP